MAEYMLWEEWVNLRVDALMERDAQGHLERATLRKLERIQSGEITVLGEGEVPPLEDLP